MSQNALKIKQDELYDVSTHFGFGANWADYAQHITDDKIIAAQDDLHRLLPSEDLEDKTVLDIGCGSGLHALAALRGGAAYVTGIDFDPDSVKTSRAVLSRFWKSNNYTITQGNILDQKTLPKMTFDIVYSWGVLHHTGNLWAAICNATTLVAPDGMLVLALYKQTPLCNFWKREKAFYTRASKPLRKICDTLYVSLYALGLLATGRNPITYIRTYDQNRGMRFMNDVTDWLGGYPYESASPDEVKSFIENLGFRQIAAHNTGPCAAKGLFGSGCAEYVFIRD